MVFQGYLSEYLFETYGYKILGLEADEQRVQTALDRQLKYHPSSRENVKYVSHLITESSMDFIKNAIRVQFSTTIKKIALVGLHACGDLTITALKLAYNESMVRGLVIMPCCYHRMVLIENSTEFQNFPLSQQLKKIVKETHSDTNRWSCPQGSDLESSMVFQRPFLRLACQQSVKHWQKMDEVEHRIHGNEMFIRSLVGAMAKTGEEFPKSIWQSITDYIILIIFRNYFRMSNSKDDQREEEPSRSRYR